MSVAARAGLVTVAMLTAMVGCDAVFRFDEPASAGSADGSAGEGAVDDDANRRRSPCADDTTCGGLRCQVATGMCVACVADADCSGARRRCDSAFGICVECLATTDCALNRSCNAVTRRCLDACKDSDDPCPVVGFVCEDELNLCIECKTSANCAGSAVGPLCDVPIGRCVACTGNAQCPTAKPVCDRRTGQCEACVTSMECGAAAACDPATHTCRQLP